MNKTNIRMLCLLLLLMMVMSSTVGCGTSPQASPQASSSAESTEAPASVSAEPEASPAETVAATESAMPEESEPATSTEWMANTKSVTLKAFVDYNPNPWGGWGSDPVSTEITRRTGVTIKVTIATTTEHEELNAMLASGDLPDFVVLNGDGPLRATLWKQGFVQPLNKLMEKYAPNMKMIIPLDMDKIWKESDGNQYFIPGYYSDVARILELKGIQQTVSGLTMNQPMYAKIGSPSFKTLEEYQSMLIGAKSTLGIDAPFLVFDAAAEAPQDDQRNMAQLINRIYGGGATKSISADGSVHLNFRDESYKKAILYIDGLYRAGLVNKEIFTSQKQEQADALFQNQKVFSSWGQPFNAYKHDMTEAGPYKAVEPPKNTGSELHWRAASTGIGGWPLASISSTSSNSERAILYYEFLLSDEGQMLTYHGIEGVDYKIVDGMPKNEPAKEKMWGEAFTDVQSKLGIINYQISWFPTNYADMLCYFWLNQSKPAYLVDTAINNPYARNERMNELIMVESDSKEKVIETKVFDLWKTMLPKMYLAETEGQCIDAYNELITKAEKLGLIDLEAAYTANYKHWMEVLK